MKLTFLGHSCVMVETSKSRLIIDPFLTGNPQATMKAADVRCDYVLITHGHNDHVGDAVAIAQANQATIVSNYEIATYLAQQGVTTHGMHIGGAHTFPFGTVKLTIAHHGSGFASSGGGPLLYMGPAAGMLIQADGLTVYHAGDTGLFLDMQLIGERHPMDVAFLPIGDNYTMGIDDAVKACELLRPRRVVPIHYQTFPAIAVDPQQFQNKAGAAGFDVRILAPGQTLEVSS